MPRRLLFGVTTNLTPVLWILLAALFGTVLFVGIIGLLALSWIANLVMALPWLAVLVSAGLAGMVVVGLLWLRRAQSRRHLITR